MTQIQNKISEVVDTIQDNEKMIQELNGQIGNIEATITEIELDLTNLHNFCKVGKQCAKRSYFGPEDFGGTPLKDCAEYYHHNFWNNPSNPSEWQGKPQSGVYIIQPKADLAPKMVYCDQKTDGGGWTLMQHKGISNSSLWEQYSAPIDDPEVQNQYQANWHQTWSAYQHGFGWVSMNGESDYWMGLDYMSALTSGQDRQRLRIDIKDWDDRDYWGYYDRFAIKDATRSFQMMASGFSGVGSYSIGDAWGGVAFGGDAKQKKYTRTSASKFSTKDRDNDRFCYYTRTRTNRYGVKEPIFNADDKAAQCDRAAAAAGIDWESDAKLSAWGSCAGQDGAGFWYNRCSAGNLNGKVYYNDVDGYYTLKTLEIENSHNGEVVMRDHDDGMIWGTLNKGRDYSFMLSEMRVRPLNFKTNAGSCNAGTQTGCTRLNGKPKEDERMNPRKGGRGRG